MKLNADSHVENIRYDPRMFSRLLFFFVAWALMLGASANAAAQDLILDRAVLRDHAGTLSIDEAAQATFTPAGPMLNGCLHQ